MAVTKKWSNRDARNAATAIVRALRAKGFTAYLAGGCVRDELLGFEPVDYDIATDARPDAIQALFRRTAAVGACFGVVLVKERGVTVEVASFRADGPYTDRRHPDHVEFSDAAHDAQRRDFTINALFLDPLAGGPALRAGDPGGPATRAGDPGGPALRARDPGDSATRAGPETHGSESRATLESTPGVIDFVGGLADLRAGVIRAVGDPEQRLAEDHLRALRAVRFAARYAFAIDPGTADAIRRHARDLEGVSRERIGEEFRRMLAHPSRAHAVGLLGTLGLDLVLLGQPGPGPRAGSLAALPDPTFPACLACLAFDRGLIQSGSQIPALVRAWRGALCLSNEETDRLRAVLGGVVEAESLWQQLPPAQRKRRAAAAWFAECLAVLTARDASRAGSIAADVGALAGDGVGLAPEPMIDGNDLLLLGVPAGPVFARVLTAVYDAQLEGRVSDKAQALALARELAGPGGV
ncbi:MAG: CCA tRNA nucleotidyltransferase [Phycisphaerales bacterium]|nr:CCA tRNA nucleotidyltransferase [Phycisphaerales bacterium]